MMSSIFDLGLHVLAGKLPLPPVMQLHGIVPKAMKPALAVFESYRGCMASSSIGMLHGGVYCDLADEATAMAYGATFAEGDPVTSVERKIRFLLPVRTALLNSDDTDTYTRGAERPQSVSQGLGRTVR